MKSQNLSLLPKSMDGKLLLVEKYLESAQIKTDTQRRAGKCKAPARAHRCGDGTELIGCT